jgi:hypothetical protein
MTHEVEVVNGIEDDLNPANLSVVGAIIYLGAAYLAYKWLEEWR